MELKTRFRVVLAVVLFGVTQGAHPILSFLQRSQETSIRPRFLTSHSHLSTLNLNSTVRQSGLTLDRCLATKDCKGSRECLTIGGNACSPDEDCFCLSSTEFCADSKECENGEVCAQGASLRSFCVSADAVRRFSTFGEFKRPPTPGDGLTFSPCENNDQCKGGRACAVGNADGFSPCQGGDQCYCVPNPLFNGLCFQSSDCPKGELCANYGSLDFPLCVSKKSIKFPSVDKVPKRKAAGLTFDPCKRDSDCENSRECSSFTTTSVSSCSSGSPCFCLPKNPVACQSSDDCITAEVCTTTPFFDATLCVSQDARSAYDGFTQSQAPIVCPSLLREDPPRSNSCPNMVDTRKASLATALRKMDKHHVSRIAGGLPASCNLVPYLVAVTNQNGNSLCTGAILSSKWVLTAQHCRPEVGGFVIASSSDLATDNDDLIQIKRVFNHPKFVQTPDDFQFDISILELEKEVPKGSRFMKLNAKKSIPLDGSPARSIGYGDEIFEEADPELKLRQVDTVIIPIRQCKKAYTNANIPEPISSKLQLCSGTSRGGCGICQGDSGGPLIQYTEDGEPLHIGLPSYTVRCGDWLFPGVFARTSAFVKWIKNKTPAEFETN